MHRSDTAIITRNKIKCAGVHRLPPSDSHAALQFLLEKRIGDPCHCSAANLHSICQEPSLPCVPCHHCNPPPHRNHLQCVHFYQYTIDLLSWCPLEAKNRSCPVGHDCNLPFQPLIALASPLCQLRLSLTALSRSSRGRAETHLFSPSDGRSKFPLLFHVYWDLKLERQREEEATSS